MPPTIKQAIADTLENLSRDNFLKFCYSLRDRREGPRVRCGAVEGKTFLEITDVLVSTFTEAKALPVAVELLRQINCNEEAQTLYSNTKTCVDKGDPTLRRTSTGKLETEPSLEALRCADSRGPLQAGQHGSPPVKKPEEVEAEAKARVLAEGGDPSNERLVLSRCTIEFGKYKGQTFKWLLENHVGYTAWLVASHQEDRAYVTRQNPLNANKDFLTKYVNAYPEVMGEVRFQRDKHQASAARRRPTQRKRTKQPRAQPYSASRDTWKKQRRY